LLPTAGESGGLCCCSGGGEEVIDLRPAVEEEAAASAAKEARCRIESSADGRGSRGGVGEEARRRDEVCC
jgi:hypothetical protein